MEIILNNVPKEFCFSDRNNFLRFDWLMRLTNQFSSYGYRNIIIVIIILLHYYSHMDE